MKPLYIASLIIMFLACSLTGFSQNTQRPTRQRTSEAAVDNSPTLSERARIKNEETSKAPVHVAWLREMYRNIDLEKDNNAALYYPVQPVGGRMNLFTIIFKLLADGKITAYNYLLDKQEVFDDAEKLNFEEVLKSYKISYQTQGSGSAVRYIVDDNFIPGSEVLQYRIKEGSYFDAATGTYKTQVTAICPLLVQVDYFVGDTTRNALFWVPYESLRPYLSQAMIMTSDYNNAMTYSIDDFFTKGMYEGDIVKTVNMRDQSLAQQVGDDPDMLKLAQDSIESQLKTFREQLWIQPDTTQVVDKNGKKVTVKEEKPKAVKPESSSAPAAPSKSVRRTR